MTEIDLLTIIMQCEQMVQMVGLLDFETTKTCMYAYETLKEMVADGDYNKYREWFDNNAERSLNNE